MPRGCGGHTDKRAAQRLALELEAQYAKGQMGLDDVDCLFPEALKRFLEHSQTRLKASSLKRRKLALETVQGICAFRRVGEVKPEAVERYSDQRLSAGISERSVNIEIIHLKQMLDACVRWGFLRVNPLHSHKAIKERHKRPKRALTKDEVMKLGKVCGEPLKAIVLGMLLTGMRRAEAVNLVWDTVDLVGGLIHLKAREEWSPKTGDGAVPISQEMRQLLIFQKERVQSRYVFPNAEGNPYSNNLLRDFKVALKRAGIVENKTGVEAKDQKADPEVDIHSLRRTFITHHALAGTPPRILQRLSRHKSFATTMNIYAKITDDDCRTAVNAVSFCHSLTSSELKSSPT